MTFTGDVSSSSKTPCDSPTSQFYLRSSAFISVPCIILLRFALRKFAIPGNPRAADHHRLTNMWRLCFSVLASERSLDPGLYNLSWS
jgi:hypothetical protein